MPLDQLTDQDKRPSAVVSHTVKKYPLDLFETGVRQNQSADKLEFFAATLLDSHRSSASFLTLVLQKFVIIQIFGNS